MAAVTQEQSPTAAGELRRVEGTGPLQDGGTRSRLNRGLLPRTQWDLLYVLRAPLAQRPQLKGDPQVCRSPGGRLKNIHFLSFSVIGSLAGYVVTHKPDYISQPLLKMGVVTGLHFPASPEDGRGHEIQIGQWARSGVVAISRNPPSK